MGGKNLLILHTAAFTNLTRGCRATGALPDQTARTSRHLDHQAAVYNCDTLATLEFFEP